MSPSSKSLLFNGKGRDGLTSYLHLHYPKAIIHNCKEIHYFICWKQIQVWLTTGFNKYEDAYPWLILKAILNIKNSTVEMAVLLYCTTIQRSQLNKLPFPPFNCFLSFFATNTVKRQDWLFPMSSVFVSLFISFFSDSPMSGEWLIPTICAQQQRKKTRVAMSQGCV